MKSLRKAILTIAVILSITTVYSKSLDNLYVSLLTEKGTVYHTYPLDLDYYKESNNLSVSNLKYDYTYVDTTDSVDVLMTVTYSALSKPLDISFDNSTSYPLSIIYIDNKGNKFIYRIKCTISYKEWVEIYSNANPINITLFCEDKIKIKFNCPDKKWPSLRTDFTNLFKLIEKAK